MSSTASAAPLPPHPKDVPILGSVPAFVRDTRRTFVDGWREVGDVVRFRGLRTMCLVAHPDDVGHVLERYGKTYRRGRTANDALAMLTGENLFTAHGDAWTRRVEIVRSVLEPSRAPTVGDAFVAAAGRASERWTDAAHTGKTLDLYEDMKRSTLDATRAILFGADSPVELDAFAEAATVANEYVIAKAMAVGGPPDVRIRPAYRRYLQAVDALDAAIDRAIRRSRERPGDGVVNALAKAGEHGVALSDREIRDEAMSFVNGMYSTLPGAMAWLVWLTSSHPEAERTLVDEVRAAEGGDAGAQQFVAAVDETLRLYPSLWVLAYEALEDDEFRGYRVPAGMSVVISSYITHRHPDFWDRPEEFDPARFLPGGSRPRHPYSYIPFSGGSRPCAGEQLARLAIRTVVPPLLARYRATPAAGHVPTQRREFVSRPANGMPVLVTERDGARG